MRTSERGRKALDFAVKNAMSFMSTYFRKSRYYTWSHIRTRKGHMIDHVMVNKRYHRRITNCACERPYCNSDHLSVDATVYTGEVTKKKSRTERSKLIGFDTTVMEGDSDEAVGARAEYNRQVRQRRDQLVAEGGEPWEALEKAMQEAVQEVCPRKAKTVKNWYDRSRSTIDGPIEARAEAQEKYIADPTDVNRTALARAKMAVKHAVSKAKNTWTWAAPKEFTNVIAMIYECGDLSDEGEEKAIKVSEPRSQE